uniref:F-box domain-containing protein n=1 Tax=Aegilops tauschii subsp. strangulata TaxID=200361 RepID=A0A452YCF6_AEGTS
LLDARSVARCTAVSRAWFGVAADNRLWAPKVHPIPAPPVSRLGSRSLPSLAICCSLNGMIRGLRDVPCELHLFDEFQAWGFQTLCGIRRESATCGVVCDKLHVAL